MPWASDTRTYTEHRNESIAVDVGEPDGTEISKVPTNRNGRASVRRLFRRRTRTVTSDSNPNGDLAYETDGSDIDDKETFISRLRDYVAVGVDSSFSALIGCILALLDFFFFITWFVLLLENHVPEPLLQAYKIIDWATAVGFLSESLLRLFAYGPRIYFRSPIRVFDMVISVVNFGAVLALYLSHRPPLWLRVVHLARLLRIVMNMAKVHERALKWRARTELSELRQLLVDERSEQSHLTKWRLDANAIALGAPAGTGAFGTVHVGLLRGTLVAVKQLFSTEISAEGPSVEEEAITLVDLRHPNILLFMGFVYDSGRLWIVTEYCSRGSLRDILDDRKQCLTQACILKFALGVARGLAYLHGRQPCVLHRDLKPSNILISAGWDVKLADFGLARRIGSRPTTTGTNGSGFAGTTQYCAPEILSANDFGTQADIYAFSICLWEMAAREEPFKGKMQPDIMFRVAECGERPPMSGIQSGGDELSKAFDSDRAHDILQCVGSSEVQMANERERDCYLASCTSGISMVRMRNFTEENLECVSSRASVASLCARADLEVPTSPTTPTRISTQGFKRSGNTAATASDATLISDSVVSPLSTLGQKSVLLEEICSAEKSWNIASRHKYRLEEKRAKRGAKASSKKYAKNKAIEMESFVQLVQARYEEDENALSYRRSNSAPSPGELEKITEEQSRFRTLNTIDKSQLEAKEIDNWSGKTAEAVDLKNTGAIVMCSEYCELIKKCWSQEPTDRPCADDLVWSLVSMLRNTRRDKKHRDP